jgi:undecaprenyl-diphosphatase
MRDTSPPVASTLSPARPRPTFVIFAVTTVIACVALMLAGYTPAVVMGIVQGLGEFLPISSSAHLILVPWFFDWTDDGIGTLTFDVALHLGTLVAIVMYFWRDWIELFTALPGIVSWAAARARGKPARLSPRQYLLMAVVIGTIPAAVLGLLFESAIEETLRSPLITVGTLAGVGILMYVVDRYRREDRSLEQITWRDSLMIGVAQACALIPGVSRSGATMTMGRFLSIDRTSAARYSFLLSAPITLAAVISKSDDMLRIQSNEAPNFIIGMLISAAIGALSIHFLLSYIKRVGFGVFALYRIVLAVVIVIVAMSRGML